MSQAVTITLTISPTVAALLDASLAEEQADEAKQDATKVRTPVTPESIALRALNLGAAQLAYRTCQREAEKARRPAGDDLGCGLPVPYGL